MNYEYEIDYEDMDDLALTDRIEWSNESVESFALDTCDISPS